MNNFPVHFVSQLNTARYLTNQPQAPQATEHCISHITCPACHRQRDWDAFNSHQDLCLFSYFSFPTCVCKYQAYLFFIRGLGMTGENDIRNDTWRAACSIFRRPRDFSAPLKRLGFFQPSAKCYQFPIPLKC